MFSTLESLICVSFPSTFPFQEKRNFQNTCQLQMKSHDKTPSETNPKLRNRRQKKQDQELKWWTHPTTCLPPLLLYLCISLPVRDTKQTILNFNTSTFRNLEKAKHRTVFYVCLIRIQYMKGTTKCIYV